MKESIIKNKSFEFSLKIIEAYKSLKNNKEYEIGSQLLRCGTSIGANIEEALAGYSSKDFTAKMSIASKEAREVNYWLRLIKESEIIKLSNINELILESEELIKILTAIVKTSQKNN